jgi:hypothetical protein
MTDHKNKSISWVVLSRLIGLMVFLVILALANYLMNFTDNIAFHQVVTFINSNIVLIILMSLIFLVAEILGALIFPFNLPAPLFNATGSIFLVAFILRIFELINTIFNKNIFGIFTGLSSFIYYLVFIIVLIGGYISIFARLFKESGTDKRVKDEKPREEKPAEKKTWEDIGDEFRQTLSDLLRVIRESINERDKLIK